MLKYFVAAAAVSIPVTLGAFEVSPNLVKNVAEGVVAGDGVSAARQELSTFALGSVNEALDQYETHLLAVSNFTHLDLTVGSDVFGIKNSSAAKTELMSVYRLKETKNIFLFNQASLVNFDGRTTANIGFGARRINDTETVISGVNAFYDYEFGSKHSRVGLGVELLTSIFELRANKYNAISNSRRYKGIEETALDGSDFKITADLPYMYSSNVYFSWAEWSQGGSFSVKTNEWGVVGEFAPNWVARIAQQKKDNLKAQAVASISYKVELGGPKRGARIKQDGKWSGKFKPIREKLYKPVQRENRIMKTSVKFGITVSGV